jgi:hypothetical protein
VRVLAKFGASATTACSAVVLVLERRDSGVVPTDAAAAAA